MMKEQPFFCLITLFARFAQKLITLKSTYLRTFCICPNKTQQPSSRSVSRYNANCRLQMIDNSDRNLFSCVQKGMNAAEMRRKVTLDDGLQRRGRQ